MSLEMIQACKAKIRVVEDFPKQGVSFKDISPLLADRLFHDLIAEMVGDAHAIGGVDCIAGIESRGFIVATAMAIMMNRPLVLIRKPGKLPEPNVHWNYETEYSKDRLVMAPGGGNLLIVDDVIAMGGTMKAAYELSLLAGYNVLGMMAMVDLRYLGRQFNTINGVNVQSFIIFD